MDSISEKKTVYQLQEKRGSKIYRSPDFKNLRNLILRCIDFLMCAIFLNFHFTLHCKLQVKNFLFSCHYYRGLEFSYRNFFVCWMTQIGGHLNY